MNAAYCRTVVCMDGLNNESQGQMFYIGYKHLYRNLLRRHISGEGGIKSIPKDLWIGANVIKTLVTFYNIQREVFYRATKSFETSTLF